MEKNRFKVEGEKDVVTISREVRPPENQMTDFSKRLNWKFPNAVVIFDFKCLEMRIVDPDSDSLIYCWDLERLTDSASVLDMIFQCRGKNWASPRVLDDILTGISKMCIVLMGPGVQGTFCPGGVDHTVDWKKRTSRPSTQ